MDIEITTNSLEESAWMRRLMLDQMPFALQQAVRAVALQSQDVQRKHMLQAFTVRRKSFVTRSVKMAQFPTKTDPIAIIKIEPPGGMSRADVIARHEEGGLREPGPGHRAKAVPIDVQPDPKRVIPKKNRPTGFDFERVKTRGQFEIYKGRRRTVMIRHPDGSGIILQRIGPGQSGTFVGMRTLYAFAAGGVQISKRLMFEDNIWRTVQGNWDAHMAVAWDKAVRTAR